MLRIGVVLPDDYMSMISNILRVFAESVNLYIDNQLVRTIEIFSVTKSIPKCISKDCIASLRELDTLAQVQSNAYIIVKWHNYVHAYCFNSTEANGFSLPIQLDCDTISDLSTCLTIQMGDIFSIFYCEDMIYLDIDGDTVCIDEIRTDALKIFVQTLLQQNRLDYDIPNKIIIREIE